MPVLEVYADVCCPFTHVGLRRLLAARDARGSDVALVVRAWPLELVNGVPIDRTLVSHEVRALRAQVAPDLFASFDASAFPVTSIPAFGVAAAAFAHSSTLGESVSLALRDAVFEQGLDVADPGVLGEVAAASGIAVPDPAWTHARVRADWHEGRRRGVVGSPHFFVDEQSAFCPALRILRTTDGGYDIRADDDRLAAFLDDAFGPG